MKKIAYLSLLVIVSCSMPEKKQNGIEKDGDIQISLTYITYYESKSEYPEAGFIVKLFNSNSHDIYIPYIRSQRALIVERKVHNSQFQKLDPKLFWPPYRPYGPFAKDIYTDKGMALSIVEEYLTKVNSKPDRLILNDFILESCFIKGGQSLNIFIQTNVFPEGYFKASFEETFSNICSVDDAFNHNPPLHIAGFKLFDGKLKSDTLILKIETRKELKELIPYN
jgi:hypothetical protein